MNRLRHNDTMVAKRGITKKQPEPLIDQKIKEKVGHVIFDAIASKRVLKTGYVRATDGLHPTECDTVAAHSHAISIAAVTVAYEVAEEVQKTCGVTLDLHRIAVLAIYHDHGEARSGDTASASHGIYGVCKLYDLEKAGLEASIKGFAIEKLVMELYEEYRKWSTAESLVVHAADMLEGLTKAVERRAHLRKVVDDAVEHFASDVLIFKNKKDSDMEKLADFLVHNVLLPGGQAIADAYEFEMNMRKEIYTRIEKWEAKVNMKSK